MNQVRVLQSEPGGQRSRVRAPERHPLPVAQPPPGSHDGAEVSEVGQGLAATEETQVLSAQVSGQGDRRQEVTQTRQTM